jgi:DnaK suppressor protein
VSSPAAGFVGPARVYHEWGIERFAPRVNAKLFHLVMIQKVRKRILQMRSESKMTQTDLNKFQKMLNTKHAELAQAMGRRDGIAIERTADVMDETQFAAERELSTRSLDLQSRLLRNVRSALDRIADGSYGSCLQCEDDISHKRLQAIPWATLCITCQEGADRAPRRSFAYSEEFLGKAA